MNELPLVEELTPLPEVPAALRALRHWPHLLLLDSAQTGIPTGRYSFLTADPFHFELFDRATYVGTAPGAVAVSDPLTRLEQRMKSFVAATVPGLPPFQGGAAGLLSYDLHRAWERIPSPRRDEFEFPALAVGTFDWVIAWDHEQKRAWIISHGFPETIGPQRTDRAAARLRNVREALTTPAEAAINFANVPMERGMPPRPLSREGRGENGKLKIEELAPSWPAPGLTGLLSNFSRENYLRAVERAIEYIYAGDIFQVNLSQRLLYPSAGDPLDLFLRLRTRNPAPFAGYFAHDDWVVASASPERFLSVTDGAVETRPIKGTRRRRASPEADLFTADELRESEKDQAENVMIVDLLRNDLSRVCAAGTIRVPALCRVESYETVQHLFSEIRGQLPPGRSAWDLFRAAFPGGSITGAPKVRAMEIIAELEPTARGPYCGSLFYVGYDGRVDSSILIRTFTVRRGWIQCPVGGGIVAQSNPVSEYEETMVKAEGMLRALR
jgi:para-aminobenzoate synthetase component 1